MNTHPIPIKSSAIKQFDVSKCVFTSAAQVLGDLLGRRIFPPKNSYYIITRPALYELIYVFETLLEAKQPLELLKFAESIDAILSPIAKRDMEPCHTKEAWPGVYRDPIGDYEVFYAVQEYPMLIAVQRLQGSA